MEKFVISLTSSVERREHILNEFQSKKIDFQFFDAIQPSTLKEEQERLDFSFRDSLLSDNEKSCFMSHYSLWHKAIAENLDYIAVFEDDIYLSNNSAIFLNSTEWIDKDFLKIEKTSKYILVKDRKSLSYKSNDYVVAKLKSSHMGAGGYILSNNAAKSLIDFIKRQSKIDHIDQIMFDLYKNNGEFNIYQMNPVLCIQDCILYPNNQKFQSSLQWRDNKKFKLNLICKIKREIKRFIVKLLEIPYKVKLVFIK